MEKKCINDDKSYYKGNEPSPKGFGYCAHAEKANTVKIGTNKKLWIVKLYDSGIKRWTQLGGYFTYHDGSKPYFVNISSDSNSVIIYSYKFNKKTNQDEYNKLICYNHIEKIIIGKSGPGQKYLDGNTILLQLNSKKFVFIGHMIYQFEITDKFVKYYSVVGNTVPYPVLLGDTNIYFMLDQKFIPLDKFPPKIDWKNAYGYFYGHINPDKIRYEKFSKKMIKIKKID